MVNELARFLISLVSKPYAPRRFIPFLALLIATTLWILNPLGRAHLSIPGNSISMILPAFKHCEINFKQPIPIQSYVLSPVTELDPKKTVVQPANSARIDREDDRIALDNPFPRAVQNAATNGYQLQISVGPVLHSDIVRVSLDGADIDLKRFQKQHLKSQSDYLRFNHLRTQLADVIFRLNEPVTNWILTFLFFGIVVLALKLAGLEVRAHVYSDARLLHTLRSQRGDLASSEGATNSGLLDSCAASWQLADRRFQFLQALGPAIGFILTVSSLIQALHPALRAANDLDAFLKGIHVAMVATFLGLLMRLIALEAARANDRVMLRAEVLLTPNSETTG